MYGNVCSFIVLFHRCITGFNHVLNDPPVFFFPPDAFQLSRLFFSSSSFFRGSFNSCLGVLKVKSISRSRPLSGSFPLFLCTHAALSICEHWPRSPSGSIVLLPCNIGNKDEAEIQTLRIAPACLSIRFLSSNIENVIKKHTNGFRFFDYAFYRESNWRPIVSFTMIFL